ncbi:unnamed protein product [Symbiodinium sp. CCMP2456]|nr:unnamed protein product [Symbiodinium sp. CCMP2456]
MLKRKGGWVCMTCGSFCVARCLERISEPTTISDPTWRSCGSSMKDASQSMPRPDQSPNSDAWNPH